MVRHGGVIIRFPSKWLTQLYQRVHKYFMKMTQNKAKHIRHLGISLGDLYYNIQASII